MMKTYPDWVASIRNDMRVVKAMLKRIRRSESRNLAPEEKARRQAWRDKIYLNHKERIATQEAVSREVTPGDAKPYSTLSKNKMRTAAAILTALSMGVER